MHLFHQLVTLLTPHPEHDTPAKDAGTREHDRKAREKARRAQRMSLAEKGYY